MENNVEKINTNPIYNPEKIKPFSGVSDQQLQYYADHNIWSKDRIKWMVDWMNAKDENLSTLLERDKLQKICMGQERTYSTTDVHPLFKRVDEQKDDARIETTRYIDFIESVTAIKNYLDEKHNPTSVEKLAESSKEGLTPYGHGSAMFKASGMDMNFDVIDKNISAQSPTVLFLKYAGHFLGSGGSGGIMNKIDVEGLSFPEFSEAWITSVESYMKIIPRLVTLLARDPKWDIRDLDTYVKAKDIPGINEVISILGSDTTIASMMDLMSSIRTREFTSEEKQRVVDFMKTWTDVYNAMIEYLEVKVTYSV